VDVENPLGQRVSEVAPLILKNLSAIASREKEVILQYFHVATS
jgi:hypothetical protein